MPDDWSSTIVAQMHSKRVTGKKLAELTGYTPQYISQVLNGHKDTSQARAKIQEALKQLDT